jgi:hypothetical protein
MTQNKDKNKFETRKLYLAAVLIAKGFSLKDTKKTNTDKLKFIFDSSPSLQKTVDKYGLRKKIEVNAHKLIHSIKQLKDVIYE